MTSLDRAFGAGPAVLQEIGRGVVCAAMLEAFLVAVAADLGVGDGPDQVSKVINRIRASTSLPVPRTSVLEWLDSSKLALDRRNRMVHSALVADADDGWVLKTVHTRSKHVEPVDQDAITAVADDLHALTLRCMALFPWLVEPGVSRPVSS